MPLRIISWNVNGIRTLKAVKETLESLDADIICFQEVKATRSSLDESVVNVPGYSSYFSFPKYLSGYSGVATFCRNNVCPTAAEEGLTGSYVPLPNRHDAANFWPNFNEFTSTDLKALESEGRALITKHSVLCDGQKRDLVVINVYCPCADPEKPERGIYQLNFYNLLQKRAEEFYKNGCLVIILGDINTTRHPIDHCDPGDVKVFEERMSRQWINQFLQPLEGGTSEALFIDTFRHLYPTRKCAYTCWNTLTGARKTNYGTRIDYILADINCIPFLEESLILADFEGSDHCPVKVELRLEPVASEKCPSICTKYWPEFSCKQRKLTSFLKVRNDLEIQPQVKRQKITQKTMTSFLKKDVRNSIKEITEASLGNQDHVNHQKIDCKEKVCSEKNVKNSSKNSQSSAWKNLLKGPPKPPQCSGHSEECLLRKVQKQGPNYGREFFVCPRPMGDTKNKEARCNYFMWVSDSKLRKT